MAEEKEVEKKDDDEMKKQREGGYVNEGNCAEIWQGVDWDSNDGRLNLNHRFICSPSRLLLIR